MITGNEDWYCVKCGSNDVVEDAVIGVNNNDIYDVIQDSQRCGACDSYLLEQKNKREVKNEY